MPVQKVPNEWGDMANLKSPEYGTSDIPDTPVPFDPGIPDREFVPGDWGKWDNWQQMLLQLKDVPFPALPGDIGKSLVLRPKFDPNSGYSVGWEIPANSSTADRLTNPRNFSITGDGVAEAVPFDGTQNVVLSLTNLVAEKWKTPRTLSLSGNATGSTSWDGSADASIAVTVNQAANAATADFATNAGTATNADHALTADNATNANNAVNADHATTADSANTANTANSANTANTANTATTAGTANAVANGALTVTLTGPVTGSGSIVGGTVTIATTASGGGGGTGGTGYATLGNNTLAWGSVTTDAGGNATITFPVAYLTAAGYTLTPVIEISPFAGSINVPVITTVTRNTGSIVLRVLEASTGNAVPSTKINYNVVGQTSP